MNEEIINEEIPQANTAEAPADTTDYKKVNRKYLIILAVITVITIICVIFALRFPRYIVSRQNESAVTTIAEVTENVNN